MKEIFPPFRAGERKISGFVFRFVLVRYFSSFFEERNKISLPLPKREQILFLLRLRFMKEIFPPFRVGERKISGFVFRFVLVRYFSSFFEERNKICLLRS